MPWKTEAARKSLQEGREHIEAVITESAKVRREFRVGQPWKVRNEQISLLSALHRTVEKFGKLGYLQAEHGLSTDDIACWLVIMEPEATPPVRHVFRVPPADKFSQFMSRVMSLGPKTLPLGLIFAQRDPNRGQS